MTVFFDEKRDRFILPPHELEDEKCAPFTREVRTSRPRGAHFSVSGS